MNTVLVSLLPRIFSADLVILRLLAAEFAAVHIPPTSRGCSSITSAIQVTGTNLTKQQDGESAQVRGQHSWLCSSQRWVLIIDIELAGAAWLL
jgi:hypothetical protein